MSRPSTRAGRVGIGVLGAVGLLWCLSMAVGFDVVADVDPARASLAPHAGAWLGTDHMGRDVFWRLVTASEAFVGPGILACVVALIGGVPGGALAGFLGGTMAQALRYLFTVLSSVPRLVLVLLVGSIYGDEPAVLAAATGLAYMPTLGEAVHARIEALRTADFVDAARAHGVSDSAILARHLLWVNCRRLVGRHLLSVFGFYLVIETTLSFIGGFGIEEPEPSWGNMLAFEFGVPAGNILAWLAPALAIWLTVLGAILAVDTLTEPHRE